MNFSPISLSVSGSTLVFNPYDRGAKGAFVYRLSTAYVNAQRLVISNTTNDQASDRYTLQVNTPRAEAPVEGCCPTERNVLLGTDLCTADIRFLSTTSPVERIAQLDALIALIETMKSTISTRDKVYA